MNPELYAAMSREMMLACRDMARLVHTQVAPLCRQSGITVQQMYVLAELRDNPRLRVTQVCDRVGMQRTNFALLSRKMEKQGLVVREQSPEDRRAFCLVATDKGLETLSEVTRRIEGRFGSTLGVNPDEAADEVLVAVRGLRATMERFG